MNEGMTFWDHLDELRTVIIRSLIVIGIMAVIAFCLKDWLFAIVLAPSSSDFIIYRWMGIPPFTLHLMNTGLTEQFMIHMKVALYTGLLAASPYIIYSIFGFVAPGLYTNEQQAARRVATAAYAMFLLGTLLNYLLIFPLTVRFLGTYQVSEAVDNMLTIQSYVDTLISMSLVMGIVFELPVVSAILGRMGIINRSIMREYRRHAIVGILVVSAIITPTTDVITLFIVAMPIWLLYEISILLIRSH
jgi:sec-independent protein translocase protein TatC